MNGLQETEANATSYGNKQHCSRRLLDVPAVGCLATPTLSASACGRSKCRRFGCRRAAKLRALTCGSCLNAAPWRRESFAARRHLLWPQVAPKDSRSEAFGDAGCRADFSPPFLAGQKGRSPAGARPGQLLQALPAPLKQQPACHFCAKRRYPAAGEDANHTLTPS